MIVRRFLAWTETASAGGRAEGVNALARAYLYSDMTADDRADAAVVLTAILDDASPLVRRALAEAFASAADAPHHIVSALATDQSDIAAVVLSRSPVLSDAELIDGAAIGDVFAQIAIAMRPRLSAPVAAALAEVAAREALVTLLLNRGADLPEFSLRRVLQRFGGDAAIREALLRRPNVPVCLRHELVAATAEALEQFVMSRGWLSEERARRVTGEARERAAIGLADQTGYTGARALVSHLRSNGALTPGLILRALLSGNAGLPEAAFIELSGLAPIKVAGLMREFRGQGFAALYKRVGLPLPLLPVFRAALAAFEEVASPTRRQASRLSLALVRRVLDACANESHRDQHRLLALLRRFEVEAARDEAREIALGIICTRKVEQALAMPALEADRHPSPATAPIRQLEASSVAVDPADDLELANAA